MSGGSKGGISGNSKGGFPISDKGRLSISSEGGLPVSNEEGSSGDRRRGESLTMGDEERTTICSSGNYHHFLSLQARQPLFINLAPTIH